MVWPERSSWNPLPAVAQAIADGEPWLLAWTLQSTTPYRMLSRQSGVSEDRLDELYDGAPVSRAEINALARAWRADFEQVVRSLPAGTLAG